jgi:alkaline phosphatase D
LRQLTKSGTTIVLLILIGAVAAGIAISMAYDYSVPSGREQVPRSEGEPLFITSGVASGDVRQTSAVIWSRANREAQMNLEYDTDPNFSHSKLQRGMVVNQSADFAGHVKLESLTPDTRYYYRVWFSDRDVQNLISNSTNGTFVTAPEQASPSTSERPISFIFAADLGGQKYCRQTDKGGYSIFAKMEELSPSFFIANGDMIYADDTCPADGPDGPGGWQNIPGNFSAIIDPDIDWTDIDQVYDVYVEHWKYNRVDPYLQSFLQSTSMYSQWDDHEVVNDFAGPSLYWNSLNKDRKGYPNIVQAGRDAFFDYSPIDITPSEPSRIYRSFNWGSDLDLIILDARSYRSPNDMSDEPTNNKTMLGADQLQWLEQILLNSKATWKVVSCDVPISVPTGFNASTFGRDGWATGNETDYSSKTGNEREFRKLLEFLDDNDIKNVVFVTTDVHFAANIEYEIDVNGDGDTLLFHELISGPLSAFRVGISEVPIPKLDTTFSPNLLYKEGTIFNFGYVRIEKSNDGRPHLVADVRGEDGLPRQNSLLDLVPQ